jgi:hypothetical protein
VRSLLGLEAAEEGVEGAFLDGQTLVGEGFAEGVAVMFERKLGQDGDDEAAAAKLEAKGIEDLGIGVELRLVSILYVNYCMSHSVCCQV